MLGVAVLMMALCALAPPLLPPVIEPEGGEATTALYETVAEGVRHGGHYYEVAARAMRDGGGAPLRSFVGLRLPTLSQIQAWLPPLASHALFYAIAGAAIAGWWMRIAEAVRSPRARALALVLLVGGMVTLLDPVLLASHEVWSAVLIALSLALRRPGRWVEAAALGVAAMLIRETAALYVIVMAAVAWAEGARREALGWAASLLPLALALAAHAWAVAQVAAPGGPVTEGWAGLNGLWFFVMAIQEATVLALVPFAVAVPVVVLSLLGWASWNSPVALRVLATILAYAALISLLARLNNFYWGLMVAPLLLVGLAFAPDAVRDLIRAALDRPRVRVRRITR